MCTQPKGPMGKSKALETALNHKLLSSHEHLKKCLFSPAPVVVQRVSASVKAENFRFLDPGSLCSSPRDLFLAELSIAMFVV